MSTLATLAISMVARMRALQRGLAQSRKQISQWGSAIRSTFGRVARFTGIATAAFSALGGIGFSRTLADLDKLIKTARKLGTTATGLQAMRDEADFAGVNIRTLDMAVQRMTRRMSEAATGTGVARGALKELGLNAGRLARLKPEQVLEELAVAFGKVENQSDKVRLAFKLFDSEGVAMVNLLDQIGRDAVVTSNKLDRINSSLDATFQRNIAIGRAVAPGLADAQEEAKDALKEVQDRLEGFWLQMTQRLAPTFARMARDLADSIPEGAALRFGERIGEAAERARELASEFVGGSLFANLRGLARDIADDLGSAADAARDIGAQKDGGFWASINDYANNLITAVREWAAFNPARVAAATANALSQPGRLEGIGDIAQSYVDRAAAALNKAFGAFGGDALARMTGFEEPSEMGRRLHESARILEMRGSDLFFAGETAIAKASDVVERAVGEIMATTGFVEPASREALKDAISSAVLGVNEIAGLNNQISAALSDALENVDSIVPITPSVSREIEQSLRSAVHDIFRPSSDLVVPLIGPSERTAAALDATANAVMPATDAVIDFAKTINKGAFTFESFLDEFAPRKTAEQRAAMAAAEEERRQASIDEVRESVAASERQAAELRDAAAKEMDARREITSQLARAAKAQSKQLEELFAEARQLIKPAKEPAAGLQFGFGFPGDPRVFGAGGSIERFKAQSEAAALARDVGANLEQQLAIGDLTAQAKLAEQQADPLGLNAIFDRMQEQMLREGSDDADIVGALESTSEMERSLLTEINTSLAGKLIAHAG